ncbi:serine hydrolase [Kribbella sandramycini]|uniref:Beta-lactamase class A n=1 Tax=Kribbella sandramycini TaxID=60450 RepID=A0A7Y4L2C5_9ACTN|nr:serine hydrolase [Kribbella sandramycini]MBB6566303.1 beta-lactamase class A [Kribbella sandramycini]NOL43034.1 serine hydrolase [Kribbella sandramycini]
MNAFRAVFDDAGVRGWLHAVAIDRPDATIELDSDAVVPMASVYKLPLLTAFCRLVDDGVLDPRERLTLDPASRTAGPTGVSLLADPVTMSLRDLAVSMMTVSDNAAADALLNVVGLQRLAALLESFGLQRTWVRRGTADNLRDLQRRTGLDNADDALALLADNDRTTPDGVYEAANASASSTRDMTLLLRQLWTGALLSDAQTAFVKATMHRQLFQHRLASGFPHDTIGVAGKTGTFGSLRHEVGVVTMPGGDAYAIAIFTLTARADFRQPRADATIGAAAQLAVNRLRRR